MPTPDFELYSLCNSLWEAYDVPFEWEYKFKSKRKYKFGIFATAVVVKDESKEVLANRLVKTFSELIAENMPEKATKAYILPRPQTKAGIDIFKSIPHVNRFRKELKTSLHLWTATETSWKEPGNYSFRDIAWIEADVYYDKGTVTEIKKQRSPLLRVLQLPITKSNKILV